MIELLKLCGFEAHEIELELPRVKKVFNKLGITAEDIEQGKQRLNKYYDIELKGVRKILRLCVGELVNLVLAREEGKTKIIYGFMSPNFHIIGSALASKSKDVYVAHLAAPFQLVVGCIFGKIVPILEAAEERWLKSGVVAHCANVKTLVGLFTLDLIPRPDLIVTAGFLCDTAPKTIDLLHELYNMPACCYDTCQDREFSEYPDAKRTVGLAAKSMRRLSQRMQEAAGFKITDDTLSEVLDAQGRLGSSVRKLQSLIETSDPMPISAGNENLWSCLSSLPLNVNDLQRSIDAIDTLYKELQERANMGLGVVEKGAPRILATNPHSMSDPRLEHLVGELGMAMVAVDNSFYAPDGRHVPNEGKLKDPYQMMALHLQRSQSNSLGGRISIIVGACKSLNIDGVLVRYHVGCRTTVGDALMINDAITKQLGIPVLSLEWEAFDPRVYDNNHEQYKKRLELFKAMLTNSGQRPS